MIIDTHVHLDVKKMIKNLDEILFRARENGVKKFVIPAIDSNDMERLVSIVNNNDDIFFAVGHHPNNSTEISFEEIKKYSKHKKCVAIGECGLDWFRIHKGDDIRQVKLKQKDLFRKQLSLAEELNLPVILHSRETDEDMLEVLSEFNVKGVIHCYVGSKKLLSLLDRNFYFGIGGVITYSSAIELKENIHKIPIENIVLETDAPYLTPVPFRNKRNESSYLENILLEISNILKLDKTELEDTFEKNTYSLFPKLV